MKIIKVMSMILLVFCMPVNAASGWKGPEAWVAEEIRQKFTLSALYQCQIPRLPESNNIWKLTFSLMASQEEHPYRNIILVNVSESTCLGGDPKPDVRNTPLRDLFDEVCPFIKNLQERLGKGRSSVDTTKDHWVRDRAPVTFCIYSEPLVSHRFDDGLVMRASLDELYDQMMSGEMPPEDYEQLRSYDPHLIGTILITSKTLSVLEQLAGYCRANELLVTHVPGPVDWGSGPYTCFNNRAFRPHKLFFGGCLALIWGGILVAAVSTVLFSYDWEVTGLLAFEGLLGVAETGIFAFVYYFLDLIDIGRLDDTLLL